MSIVWALFATLLAAAAAMDIAQYRIPNAIVLALLGLFVALGVFQFSQVDWPSHLLTGAACLALTGGLFAVGSMGAGDAKLIAVMALWAGIGALMPLFFWMAVSGLALLSIILPARLILDLEAVRGRVQVGVLPRVLKRKEGVPFGAAVAAGALIASPAFPNWLWPL